jgi:hypothetical protein
VLHGHEAILQRVVDAWLAVGLQGHSGRAILPACAGIQRRGPAAMTDRERLQFFEREAEEAYGRMYDAVHSTATARYSDAKEALYCAISLARDLADAEAVARLEARLAEIKAVFRSQFS